MVFACLSVKMKAMLFCSLRRTDAKPETPILWPPHAKNWLIGKDPDAGRVWGQEEKGTTEDEMAGWHHWLNGEWQGGLVCCDSWDHEESDTTEWLNWTELNIPITSLEECLAHSAVVIVVQLLNCVTLFATPWMTTCQASVSWSLLKLISIESVMPSNHLILCHPLLLLPSIFPMIRVFSNEWLFTSGAQRIGHSGHSIMTEWMNEWLRIWALESEKKKSVHQVPPLLSKPAEGNWIHFITALFFSSVILRK